MSEPITNVEDAVRELGALPMPVGPEPQALSSERLAEIRDRAVYLHANGVDADEYELELSASADVPALLDEIARMRRVLREACDQVASLESDLGGATARVAELERPAEDKRRAEIRSTYTALISQAEQDRDFEGAAVVQQQLAEREAVWAREDELAKEFARDPLALKPYASGPSTEESAEAGQHVEWCTGCNTDHDPDQCGYRPESGGAR